MSERNLYLELKQCRLCKSELDSSKIIPMGSHPVSGFFSKPKKQERISLDVAFCPKCDLAQLTHSVSKDLLYRRYWYESGINNSMVSSLKDVYDETKDLVEIAAGDRILDIGGNDGTLMGFFPSNTRKFIVDPSDIKLQPGVQASVVRDFWPSSRAEGKFKVVCCIAMFYDTDDPVGFLRACAKVLADDGAIVIQLTDMLSMLRHNIIDNICHEHVTYWSLRQIEIACESVGLRVFYVSKNATNGGSVRFFIGHRDKKPIDKSVLDMRQEEADVVSFYHFSSMIERSMASLLRTRRFIESVLDGGHAVDLLGASTKGNTTLSISGITDSHIRYAVEINPKKYGMYMASGIPIIPEDEWKKDPAPYLLVLPWHFMGSLRSKLSWYTETGFFIQPLPWFRVRE